MHIPLDHYRILGVPNDATLDQLQQAFEDRLQQLPRQQYSTTAIATRKQLLEESFVILADPEKRATYDQALQSDPQAGGEKASSHTLELTSKQLPGALLLLQEIGDYATVLEIGRAYFSQPIDLNRMPIAMGIHEEDVILAMALAYLELGREEWQQNQFENAAAALEAGVAILEQEDRFPEIQSEMRDDLCKLRPYRILELLSTSTKKPEARQAGLTLLQTMLKERGGLDGTQDDRSGLNVQDFLRYVQQLREHLTTTEQQELFDREASQSSAVASYLTVYTLIARGVSQGQPRFIQGARDLLNQLSDRQDIAIEQGMCWLLLGQPIAAHHSVLRSKDQDSLAFLRQYSEGAPDLIPGLYLYTENWLQQEVYPYFQDLSHKRVSLKNYFNNPEIQAALSELDSGAAPASIKTKVTAGQTTSQHKDIASLPTFSSPAFATNAADPTSGLERTMGSQRQEEYAVVNQHQSVDAIHPAQEKNPSRLNTDAEPLTWPSEDPVLNAFLTENRTEAKTASALGQGLPPSANRAKQRLIGHLGEMQGSDASPQQAYPPSTSSINDATWQSQTVLNQAFGETQSSTLKPNSLESKTGRAISKKRKWLPKVLPIVLGAGVVTGALALGRIWNQSQTDVSTTSPATTTSLAPAPTTGINSGGSTTSPAPKPTASSATTTSTAPPSNGIAGVPPSSSTVAVSSEKLSKEDAQQIIQAWQSVKADAKGANYNSAQLKDVLAGPILAEWESSVIQDKANKLYTKYTLNRLDVATVKPSGKNQAVVEATIQEKREDYLKNKLLAQKSDTYRVLYRLERQGQQWMIKGMQIL